MIKTLQELLALPQNQKDALLIMAIDRMAGEHRTCSSHMHIIDKTTSGNYMHQIVQIKCNLQAREHISSEFAKQAGIDLDALAYADNFSYVMGILDNAFPIENK